MTGSAVVRWIIPSAVIGGLAILALWLTRPTWTVISENPSYTLSGTDSAAAITGTVLIALVLAVIPIVAAREPSRARATTLALLIAAIVVAYLGVNIALVMDVFPSSVRYT